MLKNPTSLIKFYEKSATFNFKVLFFIDWENFSIAVSPILVLFRRSVWILF